MARATTRPARARSTREEIVLPVPVEEAWAILADTPRMVAIDPLLETYEPETGSITPGTLNRVTVRMGPLRTTMTTRTEELEPPHRAVFVSVSPSRPVRTRTEDVLQPDAEGCRYTVTIAVTPTLPVIGHLAAPLLAQMMARSRRRFMTRLQATIEGG